MSFALILGGMLTTLGVVFRSVAANVDETRARAVESYADAAAADAAEQERVAVAALMHDSVLAALIAAERAHTRASGPWPSRWPAKPSPASPTPSRGPRRAVTSRAIRRASRTASSARLSSSASG